MKPLGALVALIALSMGLAIHVFAFQTSETAYEVAIRQTAATLLKKLVGYKSLSETVEAINAPMIVNQQVSIRDDLIAFSDKTVYSEGETVRVGIRSKGAVSLKVRSVSHEGVVEREERTIHPTPRSGRVFLDTFAGFDFADFDLVLIQPNDFDAGWLQIEVESLGEKRYVPVFIEGKKRSEVLFVESTDTMEAYVSANGARTFYRQGSRTLAGEFSRPRNYPMSYQLRLFGSDGDVGAVDCAGHLANADFVLKRSLARMGYTFDVASDEFLNDPESLKGYKLIIFGAHNEYWADAKFDSIERHLQSGGSVLFLGGNTAYRQVQRTRGVKVIWGNSLLHTEHRNFITRYLGSYYDGRGFHTFAPFETTSSNVPFSTLRDFGEERVFARGTDFRDCIDTAGGASGIETDKLLSDATGFTVLARGVNENGGGAEVVFKELDSGGLILNFSSVALWHRITDPIISGLIQEFTDRALAREDGRL